MKIITDPNIFKVLEGENLDFYFPEKHENMSLIDLMATVSNNFSLLENVYSKHKGFIYDNGSFLEHADVSIERWRVGFDTCVNTIEKILLSKITFNSDKTVNPVGLNKLNLLLNSIEDYTKNFTMIEDRDILMFYNKGVNWDYLFKPRTHIGFKSEYRENIVFHCLKCINLTLNLKDIIQSQYLQYGSLTHEQENDYDNAMLLYSYYAKTLIYVLREKYEYMTKEYIVTDKTLNDLLTNPSSTPRKLSNSFYNN